MLEIQKEYKDKNKILSEFLKKNDISPNESIRLSHRSSVTLMKETLERNSNEQSKKHLNNSSEKSFYTRENKNTVSYVTEIGKETRHSESLDSEKEKELKKVGKALQKINKNFVEIKKPESHYKQEKREEYNKQKGKIEDEQATSFNNCINKDEVNIHKGTRENLRISRTDYYINSSVLSSLKSKENIQLFDHSNNSQSYFSILPNSTLETNSYPSKFKNNNIHENKEKFYPFEKKRGIKKSSQAEVIPHRKTHSHGIKQNANNEIKHFLSDKEEFYPLQDEQIYKGKCDLSGYFTVLKKWRVNLLFKLTRKNSTINSYKLKDTIFEENNISAENFENYLPSLTQYTLTNTEGFINVNNEITDQSNNYLYGENKPSIELMKNNIEDTNLEGIRDFIPEDIVYNVNPIKRNRNMYMKRNRDSGRKVISSSNIEDSFFLKEATNTTEKQCFKKENCYSKLLETKFKKSNYQTFSPNHKLVEDMFNTGSSNSKSILDVKKTVKNEVDSKGKFVFPKNIRSKTPTYSLIDFSLNDKKLLKLPSKQSIVRKPQNNQNFTWVVADTFRDIKTNTDFNNMKFVERLNDLSEMLKSSKQNITISRQNDVGKKIFEEKLKDKTDNNESVIQKFIQKNKKLDELINMFKESNHNEVKSNKIPPKIQTDNVSNSNFKIKQTILLHKGMSALQIELDQLCKYNASDQGSNDNLLNACKRLRGCYIQPVNDLEKKCKIKY